MQLNKYGRLSYSSIKAFAESPAAFLRYKNKQTKSTNAMNFGTMCEMFLFEQEQFNAKYISNQLRPEPKKAATTKANKAWKAQQIEQGKLIYNSADYDSLLKIKDGVFSDPNSRELLEQAKEYQKYFKIKELFGFEWHGYKDIDCGDFFIDFKVCANAQPNKVNYDFRKYKYGLQAVLYWLASGKQQEPYYIFADRNGDVSVHRISEDTLEVYFNELEHLATNLKKCIYKNSFPSFGFWSHDGIFEI